jgi:hypothetical protein
VDGLDVAVNVGCEVQERRVNDVVKLVGGLSEVEELEIDEEAAIDVRAGDEAKDDDGTGLLDRPEDEEVVGGVLGEVALEMLEEVVVEGEEVDHELALVDEVREVSGSQEL